MENLSNSMNSSKNLIKTGSADCALTSGVNVNKHQSSVACEVALLHGLCGKLVPRTDVAAERQIECR